jgi:hypothetical protein
MGETVRGGVGDGRGRRRATAGAVRSPFARGAIVIGTLVIALFAPLSTATSQVGDTLLRLERGRFTVVASPGDARLARTLLDRAAAHDTFPGLPRPSTRVRIDVAADAPQFRALIGPSAPEWGAAVAFPRSQRVIMQGSFFGSTGGNPVEVLRHELAHLALHESLGDLPPRWFDEGYASYAAGEWGRDQTLATSVVLVTRGVPTLDSLERRFYGGAEQATGAYALAYAAVSEMAALDPEYGLTRFFDQWRETRNLDAAVRAAFGQTLYAFERRWQRQVRRRYGALALVTDLAIVGVGVIGLLWPLHRAQRRRRKQRLALLREAEAAAERAERERVLDEMMAESPPLPDPSPEKINGT